MTNFIAIYLKLFGIYLCTGLIFFKIINYDNSKNFKNYTLIILSLILSLINTISTFYVSRILSYSIISLIYIIILSKYTKYKFGFSLIVMIISIALSVIIFAISGSIATWLCVIFLHLNRTNPIVLITIIFSELILQHYFFKLKRFKNGLSFITKKSNNDYLEVLVLVISVIIIFIYFFIGDYQTLSLDYLFAGMLLFSICMIPIIQKTLILYQKQKLLTQTLKDYETELAETKTKLNTALEDKHKLVKANHEFYHRQEALKQKLNLLINKSAENNYNLEISEEYSSILDRINTLSEEYKTQTKSIPNLPKTNIPEIDDMFTYLQSECIKNNIEFIVKINCDTTYLIKKLIPKNKLETLIADLTRNAIIAINHSDNNFKSIMIILGIHDNCYEFCIYDSGIEFTPNTLLNLGLKPASTHESEGGTGIGWLTTFETLNYCKASLIITEMPYSQNNYIKSIAVKFDTNNNYYIHTYRCDELSNYINSNRDIIIKSL